MRVCDFVAATDAALAGAPFSGVSADRLRASGRRQPALQRARPSGVDAAEFLRRHEHAVNGLVYDAVGRGGSISAEHGVGSLKRDELVARKSPVALAMMRAIKSVLDLRACWNPGGVLLP